MEGGIEGEVDPPEGSVIYTIRLLESRMGGSTFWIPSGLNSWRILCSSFWAMTCFPIKDYNVLPKRELRRSLQVRWTETTSVSNQTAFEWAPKPISRFSSDLPFKRTSTVDGRILHDLSNLIYQKYRMPGSPLHICMCVCMYIRIYLDLQKRPK